MPVSTRSAVEDSPSPPLLGRARPSVDSAALLQGQREVLIQHGDGTYRLRHTRSGKLILTK
ncbi:MAG: hemin uptake protein HemP [Pseudomonadota bacterium]